MDSYETSQQELDNIMGTITRIPRLTITSSEKFSEWKFRFENHIKHKDIKLWRSMIKGPVKILAVIDGDRDHTVEKKLEEYTDEDFDKAELDQRALAYLTMAIAPEIAHGFREHKSAKSLWDALIAVYEGNEDMRESRQDMLRQEFNMFNHILGEPLEKQIQRFTSLITDLRMANIEISNAEINKKLLNSLPRSWDTNVAVIRSTRNLANMTLSDVIATINSNALADKQRVNNQTSSYATANLGVSANNAFSAIPTQHSKSSVLSYYVSPSGKTEYSTSS
ncbi:hypothetical protein E9993_22955, partial [Labilibacter sediminis]